MTKYKCLSCGGTYDDVSENYVYYHTCPLGTPVPRNENIVEGKIVSVGKGRIAIK